MSIWTMMIREIAYRRLNFVLGLAGVSAAVGLLLGVLTSLHLHDARSEQIAARKEAETEATMAALGSDVKKAMQRLGFNATILPKDQSLGDWYALDYATKTMPESRASRLKATVDLVDRYQPRLRQKIKWEEKQWTILVVGLGAENVLDTSVCEIPKLGDPIPPRSCVVGYELHNALGLSPEDEITILGRVFRIAKCEKELGTKDDITIQMNLADAQDLVEKPGSINEIMFVEHVSVWGNLAEVRRKLADVLPGCQVVEIASETLSRAHARIKVAEEAKASVEREREKRALLQAARMSVIIKLVPLGSLVCACWIGLLMYQNVKDRTMEIGSLMAIGFRAGDVRTLVVSKAALLGLAGGSAGFLIGTGVAVLLALRGDGGLGMGFATSVRYFGLALGAGVVTCLLGSWLPARAAAATDPAEVLREE